VRAGQHEQAVGDAEQVERAEYLRLFAAHHVGHTALFAAEAGHDGDPARRHPRQRRRDIGEARGAGAIRRLLPALAASHHAAEQEARTRWRRPARRRLLEHARELALADIEDAARQRALLERMAALVDQCRTQGRGAPVESDERLHNKGSTCAGRGSGATAPNPCTAIAAAALA
jgi:hypothetical protein